MGHGPRNLHHELGRIDHVQGAARNHSVDQTFVENPLVLVILRKKETTVLPQYSQEVNSVVLGLLGGSFTNISF